MSLLQEPMLDRSQLIIPKEAEYIAETVLIYHLGNVGDYWKNNEINVLQSDESMQ
jgi:hypothetical protein